MGGRGRRHGTEERDLILGLVDEATHAGARQRKAYEAIGVDARTVQRWKSVGIGEDRRAGPKRVPKNKLTDAQRRAVLEAVRAPEYRNLSIKQIVPRLADEGIYLASESTMYRLADEQSENAHRAASKPARASRPKELVATAPNQVWSWDITYLMSPLRGKFFYAYIVLDVYSRKIVAHAVHEDESALLAGALICTACYREGVTRGQLTIHSDNGAPMNGATLLASLQDLGVATSFSRPSVSDDNPFSEANFRTMKYRPEYPTSPFESLERAHAWVSRFVDWYNFEHLHSAIRFVTPDRRFGGLRQMARLYFLDYNKHYPDIWWNVKR